MIGSFSLGQGAPNLESIAKARGAAYEVYQTIDMVNFQSVFVLHYKVMFYYMYAHVVFLDDCCSLVPLTAVQKKVTN